MKWLATELEWLGPSCKSWSSSVLLGKKQLPKVSRHQCDSRHHHMRKHEGFVASEAIDAFGEANVRLFYGIIFWKNLGGGLLFKVLLASVSTTCFVVWFLSWVQHLKGQNVLRSSIFDGFVVFFCEITLWILMDSVSFPFNFTRFWKFKKYLSKKE